MFILLVTKQLNATALHYFKAKETVGIFKDFLFDDTEFLADFDEGGDGFVEVLALVSG